MVSIHIFHLLSSYMKLCFELPSSFYYFCKGFGRSSRPNFSNDSMEAEQQMVESLEEWRQQLNLEKFILLGHSFGGYLATSYTISHPDRVKHLILADPWGFTEKPVKLEVPFWLKVLGIVLYPLTHLNPLATVRGAGPMGKLN